MGATWVTPYPDLHVTPVTQPDAYKDRTTRLARNIAGVLKVSNIISAGFSLFNLGI